MNGKIIIGNKEVEFRASGATPQLYKDAFKSDLLIDLSNMRDNKDGKVAQAGNISTIIQQLAFIMYLEAHESLDNIFSKLNRVEYTKFLMSTEPNELFNKSVEVMAIYNNNARTMNKPKNE